MAAKEDIIKKLTQISGVGDKHAELLYNNGINTPEDVIEKGLSGLASIPQIDFLSAKKILDGAKKFRDSAEEPIEEPDMDISLDMEDIDESLGMDMEDLDDSLGIDIEESPEENEEEMEDDSFDDEMEDLIRSIDDLEDEEDIEDHVPETFEDELEEEIAETFEDELEEEIADNFEDELEEEIAETFEGELEEEIPEPLEDELEEDMGSMDELESQLESFDDLPGDVEPSSPVEDDYDLASDLESILPDLSGADMEPDMETAREIDKWLETEVGIDQHIGEESVCGVCNDVVSIYDSRCDTCGVEFALGEVRCGHCGATINAELMSCPHCDNALVDEKTVCPLCNGIVYASERICPFCSAEFDEDRVRCSECKTTVGIDAVVCTNCDTILRQKILEDSSTTGRGGPMSVQADETSVDIKKIELQIDSRYQREDGDVLTVGERRDAGRVLFPFPAVVGQEKMKRALILNAINPSIGGVLIEGHRGTAKSVAVRALAEVLPEIMVINECRFSCDPYEPDKWCWECKERFMEVTDIPVETRPIKVLTLPLNATEDRVVGTLDIEKMLVEGKKSFEEGLLAEVNRGILYVDEINLLDDYIVDVLLDAAAMGVVTVEREEVSISYPSKFIIIGSMNPEEGALRPQLLDRMALNIKVTGIPDPHDRIEIIRRTEQFERDPYEFRERFNEDMEDMKERIIAAKDLLPEVDISDELDTIIARLSVDFEVDGHRADIVMKKAAKTNAAWEGRTEVNIDDLLLAAELTLPHRMRKGPLEQKEFDRGRLKRLIDDYAK